MPQGTVTLITGCMFSGKTTELLRRVSAVTQGVIVFKHIIDTRYAVDHVVSHGGKSCPAVVVDGSRAILDSVFGETRLIGVDESHFLDSGIVQIAKQLRARAVDVVLTSLDFDSWGRRFGVVEQIAAIADEHITFAATCAKCGRSADRTQRTTPIVDGNMIGGSESYEPRCQRCWRPPVRGEAMRRRSKRLV